MPIGSFPCSDQGLLLSSGDVFLGHRSTGLLDDLGPTDVRHAEKPPIDETQAGLPDCGRIPVGLLDKRVCYYPCLRLTGKSRP